MVDCTMKNQSGILCHVLVKVASFIFLDDFMILNNKVDFDVLIILERPFIAISNLLVNMEMG